MKPKHTPPAPSAQIDEASGTVLLRTARSAYALRVDRATGSVLHLHWGAVLPQADAVALPVWSEHDNSFAGRWDGVEEFPVDGGARFGVPALEVRFADGSNPVEPMVRDVVLEADDHVIVRLQDRTRPLGWDLHYRLPVAGDVLERWTEFHHTGTAADGDILLLRYASAHWPMPQRPTWRIGSVHGGWSGEGRLDRSGLPVGETVLGSRRGHTGHHANPWATLDAGDASEEHGEVWTVALAASGSWRLTAQRTAAGRTGIVAGEGHEGTELRLAPGSSHCTAVSLALYTDRGFGGASRAFQHHLRTHILSHPQELRPVLYNSWEATTFAVDEENQIALAGRAAALGAELFVLDDGWFRGRDDDRAGLGDWTPHPRRFPQGLRPLADEVHRLGMAFGLWVEPEMVNADSDLFRRHPDWVLHLPDRTATELRNQLVLDFSRPEVTSWSLSWLRQVIAENAVDFLKWDFNRSFSEAGVPGPVPDARRVHVEHARGVHRVLDRLRADFPHLRIEACAGGGGRVDPAILARTDQVWTSDNTDAVDRLTIQHGFSQMYPAGVMSAWVTDSPNPLTGRVVPMSFRFHSAMAGVLGIGGDLSRWTEADLTEAGRLVQVYKDIRPVVQQGTQFRLLAPGDGPLTAVQYLDASGERAVVLVWRPRTAFGPSHPPLRLRGLEQEGRYRDEDTGREWSGATLTGFGLPLPSLPPGDCASALVRLRRVDARARGTR
ncbi:alpha-galactosidase [Streptomyces lateritius]|uniref:alpha-galactosidase n=1 Tax=Streptomyces lateritius TaxID=67313 RepID=UPI001C8CE544|nr:alpha-galactosidase [Streptomyces lateritius]MBX9420894.1 alpha-galactosidase [Streptomyces lateritius]